MSDRRLGDFVLKERLGEGGGGAVYRAEQLTLGREAVIKMMLQGGEGTGRARERFLREARLASQLDHPFAAHVYGFGTETDGTLWIAMELVRGSSLHQVIKDQGPVPLARFVPFFQRLCEVLQAVHEQGIVHRDIKPANVMVMSRAGRLLPKLLDLGIARRGTEVQSAQGLDHLDDADDSLLSESPDGGVSTTATLADQLAESETMRLTQAGTLVGTPHYMAPEQWTNAASADARSDVYSLAILAYQALTGTTPFAAKSLRQLANAHATRPLPPLSPSLPAALHQVLSRGAAKRPEDRFATPTEFGAALSAASGIGVDPFTLPQLEEAVRANTLSEAPQPIAEAVALLEGARTPKQQAEAVVMVRRVVIRYLATLALASRARVGPGSPGDGPEVNTLLRKLAVASLNDDEWLSLTVELCRPFALRKAAHPLPELISFFYGRDAGDAGPGAKALSTFDAVGVPPKEADEGAVHVALLKLVPALGHVLQALSSVADYALVVKTEQTERWVGTRRQRRVVQVPSLNETEPKGVPLLVDSVGVPVLVLSPLLQVFTPAGGLPEELFFLEGAGRHGARLVALPSALERQSEEVWPWFSQHVFDATQTQAAAARAEKPPYKGLATFTAEDADNYFGREKEVETFANRLRLSSLLAVVGPSGSGKSSFILAGVLPLLPPSWRVVVLRPGANPFGALATKLGLSSERLEPQAVLSTLSEGQSLVVVVDQFEELVTLCPDEATRETFAERLVRLADDSSGRVRVVLTCRDDFLIKIQQLRALRDRLSSALQLLGTPGKEELLRVLTAPASRVGYGFDDATLPAKMVEEVASYAGALALLSFTANQLWELRDRHLHQMRANTYEALDGVGGALAHHAEVTLASLSPSEQPLVREVFRNLVTSHGTRAVLSKQEMLDVLGGGPTPAAVLEKLVTARLLVSSETSTGDDAIEIIHEALTVSWPRLVAWQREDAEGARLRDAIRASARQWYERERPAGLLWRKETLAEYRRWRTRFSGRLTRTEEAFIDASLRDEARSTLLRRTAMVSAVVLLVVGLALVTRAYGEATRRLQRLWQEQGRLAMLQNKPLEALLFSRAAEREGVKGAALNHVLRASTAALEGSKGVITRLDGLVSQVKVSPDGRWLLALTQVEVGLIALGDHSLVKRWQWPCEAVEFNAESSSALLTCQGRFKRLSLGDLAVTEHPSPTPVFDLQRTPDGAFMGALQGPTMYRIAASGEATAVTTVPEAPFLGVDVAEDGTTVLFAGPFDERAHTMRTARVVSPQGELVWETAAFDAPVIRARYDSGSGLLALALSSGVVAVFDAKSHRPLWSFANSAGLLTTLQWKNGQLYTTALGGVVSSYEGRSGRIVFAQGVSRGALVSLVFGPDGSSVFVAGVDGIVRKIDSKTGQLIWEHHGHQGMVTSLVVVGDEVISGGHDGVLWRWAAAHPVKPVVAPGSLTGAQATRHHLVVTTTEAVKLFSPDGGSQQWAFPSIEDTGPVASVDASKSGRVLVEFTQRAIVIEAGRVIWQHPRKTQAASLSTDGLRTAVAETDGTISIFEIDAADQDRPLWSTQSRETAALLLFDTLLVGDSEDGALLVWNTAKAASPAKRLAAHQGIYRFSRVNDPQRFLTLGEDRSARVWAASEVPQVVFEVPGLRTKLLSATITDDGSLFMLLTAAGALRVVDVASGKQLSEALIGPPTMVGAIAPSFGFLVSTDPLGRPAQTPLDPAREALDTSNCRVSMQLVDEDLSPRAPSTSCQ